MLPVFPAPVRPRFLLIAVAFVATFSLGAQPRLVKDINLAISPVGSSPVALGSIGGVTFFLAHETQTGHELWKTDGTQAGTRLVRDIFPGPSSGFPSEFLSNSVVGNRMIFVATDGVHGLECWSSDGTEQGTVQLADISPTFSASLLFGPVIGSTLYFTARYDQSAGRELWRTDGTPAGTRRVLDRNYEVSTLAALGSLLLMQGSDGTKIGMFTTDGTPEGTRFVAPFTTSLSVSLGDSVLFVDRLGQFERRLMRTNGTNDGTTLVRGGFTAITGFRVMNGIVYFAATDTVNGNELWRSDGTIAGTSLVADLTPGAAPSETYLLAVLGNRLLFTTAGKLWVSDGTAAGTHVLKAMQYYSQGTVSDNQYYFVPDDATYGRELWKTDGTTEGTTLVSDIRPGSPGSIDSFYIVARPGGVLFTAHDGLTGLEPWISDGTRAGTRLLRNIAADSNLGSFADSLANVGGRLFFHASDGSNSVWMSDGTTEGTSRLNVPGLDVRSGVASGSLYYFVNGSLPAFELWRSDGTVSGTFRLFSMGDSRHFTGMTPLNGGLFFSGSDPQHGAEPWFTDGTAAGTRLLKDIDPGTDSGYTNGTEVAEEGTLLFHASGVEGNEVWTTDGTTSGTRRLMLIDRYAWTISPWGFAKLGDAFLFLGIRHGEPLTLWRANTVTGEFAAVRQIPGAFSFSATSIWRVGDAIVFTAGNELWRSDGATAGTERIHEAISLPECFYRADFVVGDDLLYWYAYSANVPELWRTDGTAAGTFRLGRFPGPFAGSLQGCIPHDLHYSDGRLYFIGRDDHYGAEPWVTDGTLMGTRLLWDVNPGEASSNPASFLRIGRTLFFTAEEPSAGRELRAMATGCDGECPPRRRSVRH